MLDSSTKGLTFRVDDAKSVEYEESGFNSDSPYKKHPCKAISSVLGGFIYMMFPGALYCIGVLSPYIQSYYQIPKGKNYTADLMPATLFLNMLFMPFGSYLVQRNVNPRLMIALGGTIAFPCFIIASFMTESFLAFGILLCLGFSFNHGMAYMAPIHHCWLWWPNNPGLVSGIILGGFGFGGLIFDNVLTAVINPWGDKIDDSGFYTARVDERFMMTWRVLTLCWFGLAVIGIILMFPGP